METIYIVILVWITLLIANSLFRHFPLLIIPTFIILPIVFLPIWKIEYDCSWFLWLKTYSLIVGVTLLFINHKTKMSQNQWFIYVAIWLVTAVNIAEAVVYDITATNHLQYINGLTGLILISTLPGPKTMNVDKSSPFCGFSWDISYGWIITYSLWNLIFVYGNWPGLGVRYHIAVLGAAFFVALFNRKQWAQARAFTLGISFIVWFLFKPNFDHFDHMVALTSWYNPNLYLLIASLTFVYAFSLLHKKVKKWSIRGRIFPYNSSIGNFL